MNKKHPVRDFLIIVGVTLSLFASTETVLRIVFQEKVTKKAQTDPKDYAYQFDKDYLITMKPSINKKVPGGVSWRTNKDAFRGEELEENPDVRIMVYGDSNVQARFSELENTFPYKLEEYLKEYSDKNIEVINAAIIGMGPDQNYIKFSREVGRYKPDIVVFHIFADNDFGDIIRNRLFELDNSGNLVATGYEKKPDELLKTAPGIKERIRAYASSLLLVRAGKKVMNPLLQKKQTSVNPVDFNNKYLNVLDHVDHEYLIDQYATVLKGEFDVYKKKQPRYFSHFADHYDLDVAAYPDSESSKVKIRLMEEIIKKAQAMAAANGVEFIVLIQPSIIDSTENFSISYKDLQSRFPRYKRTNLTDALDTICMKNGIRRINLYPVFQRRNPDELFFQCCNNHWNNNGQDSAAKETATYILQNILQGETFSIHAGTGEK